MIIYIIFASFLIFNSTFLVHSSRINDKSNFLKSDTTKIPVDINIPSSVGGVVFPHEMHIEDQEIECVECHHQINAKKLTTPHPNYFKSTWINCSICHNSTSQLKQKIYTCSNCHHVSPVNIADETLSSKVVVHNKCWQCHDVGTGSDASKSCSICHSGPKNKLDNKFIN